MPLQNIKRSSRQEVLPSLQLGIRSPSRESYSGMYHFNNTLRTTSASVPVQPSTHSASTARADAPLRDDISMKPHLLKFGERNSSSRSPVLFGTPSSNAVPLLQSGSTPTRPSAPFRVRPPTSRHIMYDDPDDPDLCPRRGIHGRNRTRAKRENGHGGDAVPKPATASGASTVWAAQTWQQPQSPTLWPPQPTAEIRPPSPSPSLRNSIRTHSPSHDAVSSRYAQVVGGERQPPSPLGPPRNLAFHYARRGSEEFGIPPSPGSRGTAPPSFERPHEYGGHAYNMYGYGSYPGYRGGYHMRPSPPPHVMSAQYDLREYPMPYGLAPSYEDEQRSVSCSDAPYRRGPPSGLYGVPSPNRDYGCHARTPPPDFEQAGLPPHRYSSSTPSVRRYESHVPPPQTYESQARSGGSHDQSVRDEGAAYLAHPSLPPTVQGPPRGAMKPGPHSEFPKLDASRSDAAYERDYFDRVQEFMVGGSADDVGAAGTRGRDLAVMGQRKQADEKQEWPRGKAVGEGGGVQKNWKWKDPAGGRRMSADVCASGRVYDERALGKANDESEEEGPGQEDVICGVDPQFGSGTRLPKTGWRDRPGGINPPDSARQAQDMSTVSLDVGKKSGGGDGGGGGGGGGGDGRKVSDGVSPSRRAGKWEKEGSPTSSKRSTRSGVHVSKCYRRGVGGEDPAILEQSVGAAVVGGLPVGTKMVGTVHAARNPAIAEHVHRRAPLSAPAHTSSHCHPVDNCIPSRLNTADVVVVAEERDQEAENVSCIVSAIVAQMKHPNRLAIVDPEEDTDAEDTLSPAEQTPVPAVSTPREDPLSAAPSTAAGIPSRSDSMDPKSFPDQSKVAAEMQTESISRVIASGGSEQFAAQERSAVKESATATEGVDDGGVQRGAEGGPRAQPGAATSTPKSCPGSKYANGLPEAASEESVDLTQYEMPRLEHEITGQGLSSDILDAVVKIYATHCDPNYSLPWQMRRQTQSTSSGFVISGRRILTNAHSVEHFTVVRVKKRAGDQKYIAKVLATGNECDLALLTVADEEFWQDLKPLPFGALPELQASVIVVGYPIGGENISVTAGVVSRVEIQDYTHGASQLLGIQIDAAINSGSSGGPALNPRNEVVGIAFQSLNTGDSENIGYLVAESVVDHFLRDYEKNGKYTGFCHCGFQWQRMENISLRRSMKMKDDDSGILVRRVDKTSPALNVLKQGDIITAIDDVSISNAGTVPYRSGERISFHYIITTKFTGDLVKLRILRDGQCTEIQYELRESSENLLVPVHEHRRQPEYFTIAGLVFVALSEPYLTAEYGNKWDMKAPVRLLERLMYGSKETKDEQVVVLSQVLNAEINIGYEYVINTRVHKFNGERLRNLAHLARLVDACTDDYLRFDLDDEVVVVGRDEAITASAEILETHCIPSACSIGALPPQGEHSNLKSLAKAQTKAPVAVPDSNTEGGTVGVSSDGSGAVGAPQGETLHTPDVMPAPDGGRGAAPSPKSLAITRPQ